jgi:hypothetical protein
MFGGDGYADVQSYDILNDVWEYEPATSSAGNPTISDIYPTSATVGGGAFYMTVFGTGFTSGAKIYWGSTALSTVIRSATELAAEVPGSQIASLGAASITVGETNGTSNGILFAINLPKPTIGSLSPGSAYVDGPAFTLTINGTNFASGATAYWWTVPLATTYVNSNQITVQIPSNYLGDPANPVPVAVETVSGRSNVAYFDVLYPLP